MTEFYDDPYSYIDDACESMDRLDLVRAQTEALIAIAIILLGFVEDGEDIPAGPISYEQFNVDEPR